MPATPRPPSALAAHGLSFRNVAGCRCRQRNGGCTGAARRQIAHRTERGARERAVAAVVVQRTLRIPREAVVCQPDVVDARCEFLDVNSTPARIHEGIVANVNAIDSAAVVDQKYRMLRWTLNYVICDSDIANGQTALGQYP